MSVDERDSLDWTPLHWSVYENEAACVELLLAHGAPVNAADSHGITALHVAACSKWVK